MMIFHIIIMYIVTMKRASWTHKTGSLVGYTETFDQANLLAGRHFAGYWLREFFCWEYCHPDDIDKHRYAVSMLIPVNHMDYEEFVTRIQEALTCEDGFDDCMNAVCKRYCNVVAQLFNNDRVREKVTGASFYDIVEYIPPVPVDPENLRKPIIFISEYTQHEGDRALKQARGEI